MVAGVMSMVMMVAAVIADPATGRVLRNVVAGDVDQELAAILRAGRAPPQEKSRPEWERLIADGIPARDARSLPEIALKSTSGAAFY